MLRQVACVYIINVSAYEKVVSKIANKCVEEAVIVIIIAVSIRCEQWHKSSAKNKEF